MIRGGKSGPALVPGKPEESLILCRIHDEEMPPRKSLIEAMVKPMEADEVDKLTRWIALGAPEVAGEPDRAGSASEGLVTKEDREFWSFQPPRPASLPKTPMRTGSAIRLMRSSSRSWRRKGSRCRQRPIGSPSSAAPHLI